MSALDVYRAAKQKRDELAEWLGLVGKRQHFKDASFGHPFKAIVTIAYQHQPGGPAYHEKEYVHGQPFVAALAHCWAGLGETALRIADQQLEEHKKAAQAEYRELFGEDMQVHP